MKKTAAVVACLSCGLVLTPVTVSAQDDSDHEFRFYGRIHVALNHLDDDADTEQWRLSNNSSRIGLRGGSSLVGDTRWVVQMEAAVNVKDSSDLLSLRDSFLGLSGDWGLLRLGKMGTPMKSVQSKADLFGDQLGEARNIIRGNYAGLQGFDERFNNSINYRSPAWNGLTAEVHYTPEPRASDESESAWSSGLVYAQGPVRLAVARERWEESDTGNSRSKTRASAQLELGAWRLIGLAQRASSPDDTSWGGGVERKIGDRVKLRAQYYRLDADDSDFDSNMLAIGATYQPVSHITTYVNLARTSNNELQNRNPWRQSSDIRIGLPAGNDGTGLAVGVMYNF